MKLFATALCAICGIAAALFLIGLVLLSQFWEPPQAIQAAVALAGLPMLTFPKLIEVLEQQQGRKNLAAGKQAPIYDFKGYQIAWPLMALYGFLVLYTVGTAFTVLGYALAQTIGLVSGVDLTESELIKYLQLQDIIVTAALSYFVGRWIGTRCSSKGMIAILLIIFLSTAMDLIFNFMFPDEPGYFPTKLLSLISLPFAISAGIIGYRRGRKYRLSRYLHYLLSVLPPETRDTVIDLAFGEAQKIGSRRKWSLWSA
jgi:hypothetical protein